MKHRVAITLTLLCLLLPEARADSVEGWHALGGDGKPASNAWVSRNDDGTFALALMAGGDSDTAERWERSQAVQPGRRYRVHAEHFAEGLESPAKSVVVTLHWIGKERQTLGETLELPVLNKSDKNGWQASGGAATAPAGAEEACLQLCLKDAASGRVHFRNVKLEPIPAASTQPATRPSKD